MNLEIHGFSFDDAAKIGMTIWGKLSNSLPREEFHDCTVTSVPDHPCDHNLRKAPFFRVFSNKKADFKLVADLLRPIRMPGAGMRTYVECILLDDCLELDESKPKKTEADYNPISGNIGP